MGSRWLPRRLTCLFVWGLLASSAGTHKERASPLAFNVQLLPKRFSTDFKRTETQTQPRLDRMGEEPIMGRWVYDYNLRTMLVELLADLEAPSVSPASSIEGNLDAEQ